MIYLNIYVQHSERVVCVEISVGDIRQMKKNHVCGSNTMKVLRVGADFRLECEKCGHIFMIARSKCEKNIKSVIHKEK